MPVYWLSEDNIAFPDPENANPDGVLAIGGDLSVERLLLAYSMGLFPWFNPNEPILWWSPDPRFVLFPEDLKVSKSMRSYFNQNKFEVSFDQNFEQVIRSCKVQNRKGQLGTWISEDMVEAYTKLHELGFAHSVEVWEDRNLVAGLYGIAIGKIFFGESMFTRVSNGSKYGFITLVRKLIEHGFELIDCQQETQHLASLGAKSISRSKFQSFMHNNKMNETWKGNWKDL